MGYRRDSKRLLGKMLRWTVILPLFLAACAIAGYLYSLQQHIPTATTLAVLPAFLLEAGFFYVLAVDGLRARVEKMRPAAAAGALTVAAVAPYVFATVGMGTFRWESLGWILLLAGAASFWYVVLPHRPAVDVFFLIFIAVVWLSKILHRSYLPSPHPRVPMDALAQLMWFRTGIFAMVCVRRTSDIGFGFWPTKRDWKIGLIYYVAFLGPAALLAWWMGFAKLRVPHLGWERSAIIVATFFGVLWVLALGEEFFFRGLLQQWMTGWLGEWLGLIVTSLIFGSVHLWFRKFPNWRIAAIATLLGIACGLAFRQAKSIRASMVTHALVVTTWRVFFS
jgi:membrane protease YdiL (CAAX protease family)